MVFIQNARYLRTQMDNTIQAMATDNTKMHRRSILQRDDGATMIEFAIIAPVLFFLMLFIIDMALYFYASSIIEIGTTKAARQGITGNTYGAASSRKESIRNEITRFASIIVDVNKLDIYCEPIGVSFDNVDPAKRQERIDARPNENFACDAGAGGEAIIYHVTYDWKFFVPYVNTLVGGNVSDSMVSAPIRSSMVVLNETFGAAPAG